MNEREQLRQVPRARVLVLAEFDPAGVLLSHREVARACGIDFRVALHHAYTARQREADWIFEHMVGPVAGSGGRRKVPSIGWPGVDYALTPWPLLAADGTHLVEFAQAADTIVICPGIGQGWADRADAPVPGVEPAREVDGGLRLFNRRWDLDLALTKARRVAYLHGSVHTWQHRQAYAAHYRELGYELATSTLDYAAAVGATYLPPVVADSGVAPLRADDDPLIVAHCPTNPAIAGTDAFLGMARQLGVVVKLAQKQPHALSLAAKATAHATYDHLRGTFSVNTVEAAAAGSVPLVGLTDESLRAGEEAGVFALSTGAAPFPPVYDAETLRTQLFRLVEAPALTRDYQRRARDWWRVNFAPMSTSVAWQRIEKFYLGRLTT